jgi:DNA (cytosine-5)-methyltransferase 1
VFLVSIRKDLDTKRFRFPDAYPLKKRLKDLLEKNVDEKYFLSDSMLDYCFGIGQKESKYHRKHPGSRAVDNFIKVKNDKVVGEEITDRIMVVGKSKSGGERSLILSEDGICNSLTATDYKQPKQICIKNATKQGYVLGGDGDGIDLAYPESTTRRGRVKKEMSGTITCNDSAGVIVDEPIIVASRGRNPENPSDRSAGIHLEQRLEPNKNGLCNTLTTVQKDNYVLEPSLRIRKLTPKECWRLQGFDDSDIEKCIVGGVSNTQLYKQAGNSITVDVAEELLCMLFDEDGDFYI